ncbi:MAG: hypothetical protein GHHEDOFH_01780 [Pseudorhodoplanes sp.]|nr:hypothetical protein [Pseudorhodoplanes sp.]
MPTETAIIVSAVVIAFVVFGVVLAWADVRSRGIHKA